MTADVIEVSQERDVWVRLPRWLLTLVNPTAVVVYAGLANYSDLPDGARPSHATLANDLELGESTVRRAISELAKAGAIMIEQRWADPEQTRQLPNRYRLLVKAPLLKSEHPPLLAGDPTPLLTSEHPPCSNLSTESDLVKSDLDSQNKKSSTAVEVLRQDVERLCSLLADRVGENTGKRPTITEDWRRQCRLLLDRDGATEQQAAWLIDWATRHEFWHLNILGMPKFRAQFGRLAAQARVDAKPKASRHQQETDDYFDRQMARAQQLDRQAGAL